MKTQPIVVRVKASSYSESDNKINKMEKQLNKCKNSIAMANGKKSLGVERK